MTDRDHPPGLLDGQRVVLVGRLASMSKRDATRLIREHGGTVVDRPAADVHWVVVGEAGLPLADLSATEEWLDQPTREAADRGTLRVATETQLWQHLGLVDQEQDVHRLYTPAMLADLVGVEIGIVRRWHRRGLIKPVRMVRQLPYFDFQEVATARRLAELLAAGVKPWELERKLEVLARYLPDVERPLAQLSVIVEGKDILLRQGDGLIEPGGQLRFDFGAAKEAKADAAAPGGGESPVSLSAEQVLADRLARSPEEICRLAAELEDDGQLPAAAEMYRAAMAVAGPSAAICFQVAELLYRIGDLAAARERYYMAVELDEDCLEGRANLGCVLAELGQLELAVAAFEGALALHEEYADVHYHLARTLDQLQRPSEADRHWRRFLDLAPDSPWAEQARSRLD
ncbi:MAG: MerR family transcriptional regulator [Pirellulales bacterium]|jgi:tetratricopeptide (TPR) repeat protein|nr:MerR family transcriptional regulator [Thermoguttaceae bacterium]MDD4787319.1 MerR family transcriptional regulator [Pirellulales bacterium]NLZ02623.1 MerR family transcriptional regulator [Pirellulaceae bacterium]